MDAIPFFFFSVDSVAPHEKSIDKIDLLCFLSFFLFLLGCMDKTDWTACLSLLL